MGRMREHPTAAKWLFLAPFSLCFVFVFAAMVADSCGRTDLVHDCLSAVATSMGAAFFAACFLNYKSGYGADVIY